MAGLSHQDAPSGEGAITPVVRLFVAPMLCIDTSASVETPVLALSFKYADGADADPSGEHHARCVLEGFGATDLELVDHLACPVDLSADYLVRVDGDIHSYCEFTRFVVPQLRDMGWEVTVETSYPYQICPNDSPWYANVKTDDQDWFSMELGVRSGDEHHDLLPTLLDMLQSPTTGKTLDSMATRGARVAIRANDTHCVSMEASPLQALLQVLSELYPDEQSQFSVHDAAALQELDALLSPSWDGPAEVTEHCVAGYGALGPAPTTLESTPPGLKATLRGYQEKGVAWLQHLRQHQVGAVLADDMGLGKTLQTIAHLSVEKAQGRLRKPALIVAPTSLVGTWEREIQRFAPNLRRLVIHGPHRHDKWPDIRRTNIVITSYPIAVRDSERLLKWDFHYIILDEAQTIKNRRSQVHGAVKGLRADHRLCLTGTPLENNLGELWTLFDFLNPGLLGDELHFRRRFRTPIEQEGDEGRLRVLRRRVAPYIMRRLKQHVATELPPKTELNTPVTLRGPQRDLYEAIRVAAHSRVRQAIRKRGLAGATVSVLDALMKLRQVCCDPRLVNMEAASGVRHSAKYERLMQLFDQLLPDGHRILVFSQFTSMLRLISQGLDERKVPWLSLTGQSQKRQQLIDRFEQGEGQVFLISLKAGGTGLTLTSADTVVHYDPWWNPAAQDQATARAYRIGQTQPVFAYNLFVAGSVEERILRLQQRKRELADAILADEWASKMLDQGDIEALFSPLDPEAT